MDSFENLFVFGPGYDKLFELDLHNLWFTLYGYLLAIVMQSHALRVLNIFKLLSAYASVGDERIEEKLFCRGKISSTEMFYACERRAL